MVFKPGKRRVLEWITQTKWRCHLIGLIILLAGATGVDAQRARGELRIEVHDPRGASVASIGELVSDGNQFHRNFHIAHDGRYVAQDLPYGSAEADRLIGAVGSNRVGHIAGGPFVLVAAEILNFCLLAGGSDPEFRWQNAADLRDELDLCDAQS